MEDAHSEHTAVNTELVPASSSLVAPGKRAPSNWFPAFPQEKSLYQKAMLAMRLHPLKPMEVLSYSEQIPAHICVLSVPQAVLVCRARPVHQALALLLFISCRQGTELCHSAGD